MGCADTFRPLLAELPCGQHVVALDFPGAGRSERRAGLDATLPAIARATLEALKCMGLQETCLLGHSHGGSVAMQVAQIAPERVRSMVLLAPAHPYFREGDPLIRFYLTLPGRLFAYAMPWFPRWMQMIGLRRMAGPQSWDSAERLKPYRDNLRTPGTICHLLRLLRSWHEDMAALHRSLCQRVEQATLLLWGDCDRAVPHSSATELRRHFDSSQLHLLHGVGHRPAEERPEIVAGHLMRFLGRIEQVTESYSSNFFPSQTRSASRMTPSFDAGD